MSNKHLNVEYLGYIYTYIYIYIYIYADHVFGFENWSHEIKNQTSLFTIIYSL